MVVVRVLSKNVKPNKKKDLIAGIICLFSLLILKKKVRT